MSRLVQTDTFRVPYNLIQFAFQTVVDGGSYGGRAVTSELCSLFFIIQFESC